MMVRERFFTPLSVTRGRCLRMAGDRMDERDVSSYLVLKQIYDNYIINL